jgi:transaldolase / glucose-6-phosphate isomerase
VSATETTVRASLPPVVLPAVTEKLEAAVAERVGERLKDADATLWGPEGTPEIANRLGWLTIAERMLEEVSEIEAFAGGVRSDGIEDVVLLGMGGSSLAPEVLRRTFGSAHGHARLHVLDSTDPAEVKAVETAIAPERTLFLVSSKSGGTIEPLSLFAHFHSLVADGRNFAAITDPGSGLAKLAEQNGFRHTFLGDPNIGGRYSALSPFGIVPAALTGIDVRALLSGAAEAFTTPFEDGGQAGVWLGSALAALAENGRDKLTFVIAETLPGLGLWLEQLIAESTGKHGKGILPVAEEPLGDPGDYGEDRVFAHLPDPGAPNSGTDARVQALADAGHPVITIPTNGPRDLGRVFMLAELAVAVAGWGLAINPYDQPNVQQAKDATNKVLDGYRQEHRLPTVEEATDEELRELLLGAGPPAYVALMGYMPPDTALDEALGELRAAVRAATKATTTFGYGPRFLHSTGQFHKGGPKVGRFLQLLHGDEHADVEIPGQPFSFGTLEEAQAIGDLNTLRETGLPAQRTRLSGNDPVGAVRALTAKIREWT